ncbi:MAG TPA: tetratricopeptide repeat protein [Phycisphaerae bacterium]|nr:tetratricopeptide repeat protein [Phycisphaerae bacterium]
MNSHVLRAHVLLEQSRYDLAEQELRLALSQDPNDALAFALLAMCLAERERFKEATEAAHRAIELAPDDAFAHFALACVLNDRQRPKEAEVAAREAIRLNAEEPRYHGMLAITLAQQERWQDALQVAEFGLQLDPEHVMCTNARAIALAHLGRRTEAIETTRSALAEDPENAMTHANHGWMLLRHGKPDEAMAHFREALRLDPTYDWARAGIVEALKARHRVYRWLLRYLFWMSTLSSRARWGVVIGLYVGYRLSEGVLSRYPESGVILWPLIGLYIAFVMLTWVGQPMFSLLLRLNRFGRLALSDEQRRESTWVGLCMLGVPVFIVAGLVTGKFEFYIAALASWLLVIPVAGVFKCHEGWPRTVMITYAAIAATIAVGSVVGIMLVGPTTPGQESAADRLLSMSLFGCILLSAAATWLINILGGIRPKR